MDKSPLTQVSWNCDGLQPGWAFFIGIVLIAGTWWGYRMAASNLSRGRRVALVALRSAFLVGLLIVLTRPVMLLTTEQPVRGALLVLIDASQSMNIADHRETEEDKRRAAIVMGETGKATDLFPSRWELLKKLSENVQIALWPRLQEKAELVFYSLGRGSQELGTMFEGSGVKPALAEGGTFFPKLTADEPASALGTGLQEVLDQRRGQTLSGILLITDGANNSGIPPLQAAGICGSDRVPLFIYGMGVSQPHDLIVSKLEGPATSRIKERAEFKVSVQGLSLPVHTVAVVLKANGQKVDEKTVDLSGGAVHEVSFAYEPQRAEEVHLEAVVAPQEGEVSKENNSATAKLRITDDKIKVLVIDQEPRWDLEFLLATLHRDKRLVARAILVDGDDSLKRDPDYLPALPEDKNALYDNTIIILGDVDPVSLGDARMKMLAEWVSELGGGLLFHAGPKFNPRAYRDTPLAPLLPVEPATVSGSENTRPVDLVPLSLTTAGKYTPVLKLSEDEEENLAFWRKFPGVRWAAHVERAKPGTEVLLTRGGGEIPVVAVQNYGAGQTMFIGTDETYRWRTKVGGKHYAQLWGQMIALLATGQNGTGKVRLRVGRPRYAAGEKIVISGKIFRSGFAPLTDENVPGTLTVQSETASAPQKTELTLRAVPGRPGDYRAETFANEPGRYRFVTALDADAGLVWEVSKLNLEQSETAMNESLLRDMADAAKGHFLREEDLQGLPERIAASSITTPLLEKIDLALSAWFLTALMLLAVAEWVIRRISELK